MNILNNTKVQLLLGVVFGLIVVFMVGYILQTTFFTKKAAPADTAVTVPTNLDTAKPNDIIARVGEERIYKNDLDLELTSYPPQADIIREQLLLKKIVKDSIILQAGAKEGLITLDASVYDSATKDYLKRIQMVEGVKDRIEEKSYALEGNVISIWFGNTIPAPIGPEAGKALALSKITSLHQAVKNKQMTIERAAEAIRNDTSLAQIDPTSYKTNALLPFKVKQDEAITLDPAFDTSIRRLNVGEVSAIYLAKAKDSERNVELDALYMFAQVKQKTAETPINSFDAWYEGQKTQYEIIIN
ncbi:MAG: hypothetical protein H0W89_01440 [Candidatus Levybacteria bacterium]|nr:hypothetical protein [Candidatus Levybacteria bacterium]